MSCRKLLKTESQISELCPVPKGVGYEAVSTHRGLREKNVFLRTEEPRLSGVLEGRPESFYVFQLRRRRKRLFGRCNK